MKFLFGMFQLGLFLNVSISCFIHSSYYTISDKESQAYNEIKDRKGYLTPEGMFVKEDT